MPRLDDADVTRLMSALRGAGATTLADGPSPADGTRPADGPPSVEQAASQPAESGRIREKLAARANDGSVGRGMEASLHAYLRRSVRCTAVDNAPSPVAPLSFETGESPVLRLDLDADLAATLSDIIIGGEGRDVRHRKRARIGALLEPLALQILGGIAASAGIGAPAGARFVEGSERASAPLIGGTISVGDIEGAWSAAIRVDDSRSNAPVESTGAEAGRVQTAAPAPSYVAPREIVHAAPEPSSKTPDARHAHDQPVRHVDQPPRERVLSARVLAEPDSAFAGAVQAACAQLGEIMHCSAVVQSVRVTRVEAPALARDHLKLALIAGGQGSLILSLDRDAVAGVASAAVGADLPPSSEPGPVVIDAVEAVLRAALRGFAEKLPGIAGSPQRFVRLAEGALPARSPHYAVTAPLNFGTRLATMHWLVPMWMVSTGDTHLPSDAH